MPRKAINSTVLIIFVTFMVAACGHTPQQPTKNALKYSNKYHKIGKNAARVASRMVGTRYRYGGTTPKMGFDCSGLVQYSYQKAGIRVPRNTKNQRRHSFRISYSQLQIGDLLFFNQLGRRASHVGIYIGNDMFVHAPSSGKRVRISTVAKRYWRRSLDSIRRFNIRKN